MQKHLRITLDGSHTLHIPELNENYHSTNGAITESQHVYIRHGYHFHQAKNPVVFEIGFGTGLNCLLTATEAVKAKRETLYIALELDPLPHEIIAGLNYGYLTDTELFAGIHLSGWGKQVRMNQYFKLLKLNCDLNAFDFKFPEKPDVVYFDAFGPDKQPEMWNYPVLQKIYNTAANESVFVTYSAKGEVRRNLQKAGYHVERLEGPPGKKEMLRGIKNEVNGI